MQNPVEALEGRIERDDVPTQIEVEPTIDGPVVVIYYRTGSDIVLDLADAREVTGEPDELHGGAVLVELREHDRTGRPSSWIDAGVRYIEEIRDGDLVEETASYVHVSDYDNNHTHHPHQHLVTGYTGHDHHRYWLFE